MYMSFPILKKVPTKLGLLSEADLHCAVTFVIVPDRFPWCHLHISDCFPRSIKPCCCMVRGQTEKKSRWSWVPTCRSWPLSNRIVKLLKSLPFRLSVTYHLAGCKFEIEERLQSKTRGREPRSLTSCDTLTTLNRFWTFCVQTRWVRHSESAASTASIETTASDQQSQRTQGNYWNHVIAYKILQNLGYASAYLPLGHSASL